MNRAQEDHTGNKHFFQDLKEKKLFRDYLLTWKVKYTSMHVIHVTTLQLEKET